MISLEDPPGFVVRTEAQIDAQSRMVHVIVQVDDPLAGVDGKRPPLVPGLDLASVYVPAFTLGGDFFDFIPLPEVPTTVSYP